MQLMKVLGLRPFDDHFCLVVRVSHTLVFSPEKCAPKGGEVRRGKLSENFLLEGPALLSMLVILVVSTEFLHVMPVTANVTSV